MVSLVADVNVSPDKTCTEPVKMKHNESVRVKVKVRFTPIKSSLIFFFFVSSI